MTRSRPEANLSTEPELAAYLEELLGVGAPDDSVATVADVEGLQPVDEPLPPGCPPWLTPVFAVAILHLGKLRFAVPGCQIHDARQIGATGSAGTGPVLTRLEMDGHVWLVVDTARLILPGQGNKCRYQWTVPVRRSRVALACDRVSKSEPVSVAQVRWREQRQSRSWLLGMLTGERAYPLLDVNALIADLQSDLIQSR